MLGPGFLRAWVVADVAGRANRASLEVQEAGTNEARAQEWR